MPDKETGPAPAAAPFVSRSPSAKTWRRVIDQAHEGDPRHLLELLLRPSTVDGQGNPLPGAFVDLPDDEELRIRIVDVLIFGPHRKGWKTADNLDDLMMKTGWGKTKPRLSDFEIDASSVGLHFFGRGDAFDTDAAAAGLKPETLVKLIRKRNKDRKRG